MPDLTPARHELYMAMAEAVTRGVTHQIASHDPDRLEPRQVVMWADAELRAAIAWSLDVPRLEQAALDGGQVWERARRQSTCGIAVYLAHDQTLQPGDGEELAAGVIRAVDALRAEVLRRHGR